jgi:two-component system, chemotaxis family, sensor kinase CheA
LSAPDPEVLEIFREEANERLDAIVDALLAAENAGATAAAVDQLFRNAHTIKGSADMLGLHDVKQLAHAVEDLLHELRPTGVVPAAIADPLLRAADAIRALVNGNGSPRPDILEELRACLAAAHTEPTEPAAVTTEDPEHRSGSRRSLRVPAEKLDRLLDLVGESVLHRQRLVQSLYGLGAAAGADLQDELDHGDRLLGELQGAAIEARTLPLGTITGGFPRAVRDIAVENGKDVQLVVEGEKTELDRVILERLSDPIVHLLRNAVAHGIEPPAERERQGKPTCGRIVLSAIQRGGLVAVTVEDDGRGLPGSADIETLTRSGFSTHDGVTELAGRGVGLGAVKSHVEALGGGLEVESEPGRGARITLLLPLTLAVLDVLLVERGRHVFGLPLSSVDEAIAIDATLSLLGRPAVEIRGSTVGLLDLAAAVGADAPAPGRNPSALVIKASGRQAAVVCDRLLGEQQVVVKSLGPLLTGVQGYLGAAILGDGRIALLLDPSFVVRADSARAWKAPITHEPAAQEARKLLVVEDSFTVRELQRSILEAAGYTVETARNGREALDRLLADPGIALVVTDVDMPEMDGITLTREIRSQPERSSLPVIVVTSRADPDDQRRGIEAGADAYMIKRGFEQQTLTETVARLLAA